MYIDLYTPICCPGSILSNTFIWAFICETNWSHRQYLSILFKKIWNKSETTQSSHSETTIEKTGEHSETLEYALVQHIAVNDNNCMVNITFFNY